MDERTVRQARADDHEAIAAFTEDTWSDREVGDYVPDAFPEWVETDGPDQHTAVVVVDGDPVGLAQARLLGDHEGWLQGIRIHPEYREQGHGNALTRHLCAWCRDRDATVARNMVFAWNEAGMGQSRRMGFAPGPACRWATLEPDERTPELAVTDDPDAAWRYWTHSDTRSALSGLALADDERWAVTELTRDRLDGLADAGRVLTVGDADTRGMTARLRTRESDGETTADYAVAAWEDDRAARALFDAIRADAAAQSADRIRVLFPDTTRHVSEAALARATVSDHAVYVFTVELTGEQDE